MKVLIGDDSLAQLPELRALFEPRYKPEGVVSAGQLVVSVAKSRLPECPCTGIDLADQPEQEAAILDALGIALLNRGCRDQGSQLIEQALNIRRASFGDHHPATACSLVSNARKLREHGELSQAEIEIGKALRINRGVFGNISLPVAVALVELGLIQLYESRFKQAKRTAENGLNILHTLGLAESDRNTTRFMDMLARAQLSLGMVSEAEATFKELLALDFQQLKTEAHPKFVTHRTNSAGVLTRQKRFAEAAAIYQADINFYSQTLKLPCHPNLIDAHTVLSTVLRRIGGDVQLKAARENAQRALDLNKLVRGETHERVGNSHLHLGIVQYESGDTGVALQSFSNALAIYDQNVSVGRISKNHIYFAEAGTWRGRVLVETNVKDLSEAKQRLERALEIWPARLGPGSPGEGIALASLGRALFVEDNKSTRARSLFDAACAILFAELGPEHVFIKRLQGWRKEAGLPPCECPPRKSNDC